eukprot:3251220-Pleurochrysis_carterae.AAC.6
MRRDQRVDVQQERCDPAGSWATSVAWAFNKYEGREVAIARQTTAPGCLESLGVSAASERSSAPDQRRRALGSAQALSKPSAPSSPAPRAPSHTDVNTNRRSDLRFSSQRRLT